MNSFNLDTLKIAGMPEQNAMVDKIFNDLEQKAQHEELINTIKNLTYATTKKLDSVSAELKAANAQTEKETKEALKSAKLSRIISWISASAAVGAFIVAFIALFK